jgi:hypothetical protein
VASLRELQASFATALRDDSAACPVLPRENLSIYRNNAAIAFRTALGLSFPVLCRRVGDDYFRQLATKYRQHRPSRSGDLHWVGRDFAAFLAEELHGSEYCWLADLARLEWAREQAAVATAHAAIGADALARFAPTQLEHVVFTLQPSLGLHASDYPIFTIWDINQVQNAPPVDQSLPGECGMVRSRIDGVQIRRLDAKLFSFLSALSARAPLGEAVSTAGLDQSELVHALGFVFQEALVCAVTVKAAEPGS